ncbi:aldo/keto reductase [Streptomyces massasporeus]|uniref:aldo/keto reductase n=1 Tax=Streptomyces massasporeus TaxID=67324 RepID=UPI0036951E20
MIAWGLSFGSGRLSRTTDPGVGAAAGSGPCRYFRDDSPAQVERRVAAIRADLGIGVDDMAETALRFVLSHPVVSTLIPGMRGVRDVERNTALSDGRPLTDEQLATLAGHRWQRAFYG